MFAMLRPEVDCKSTIDITCDNAVFFPNLHSFANFGARVTGPDSDAHRAKEARDKDD